MIDFWQDARFAYAVLGSKFTSFSKIVCRIKDIHDRVKLDYLIQTATNQIKSQFTRRTSDFGFRLFFLVFKTYKRL